MRHAFRHGALALGLIAGATLIALPASAGSIQRHGYFGGTWEPIGPRDNRHVQRHYRKYGYYPRPGARIFYDRPGYYYGPRYSYLPRYYGPDYYYGPRDGLSFGFTIR